MLASLSYLPLLIGTKEPLCVKMSGVARCHSDPDLGLPCDFGEVLRHGSPGEDTFQRYSSGTSLTSSSGGGERRRSSFFSRPIRLAS